MKVIAILFSSYMILYVNDVGRRQPWLRRTNTCGSSSSSGGELKLPYNHVNSTVGSTSPRSSLSPKECFGVSHILSPHFEVTFSADYFGLLETKGILFMYNLNTLYSTVHNKKKE